MSSSYVSFVKHSRLLPYPVATCTLERVSNDPALSKCVWHVGHAVIVASRLGFVQSEIVVVPSLGFQPLIRLLGPHGQQLE